MMNLTVNVKNYSIEMTKTFAAAASKVGSEEYRQLQEARRDYPNYKVVTNTRKISKSDKPSFKGLTFAYMEKYILAHDDKERSIMNEYLELRGMSVEGEEALAESFSYQGMKNWFLDKFPAVADFHEKRNELLAKAKQKKEIKREAEARAKREALRNALLTKMTA